jgi:hypothetical protein
MNIILLTTHTIYHHFKLMLRQANDLENEKNVKNFNQNRDLLNAYIKETFYVCFLSIDDLYFKNNISTLIIEFRRYLPPYDFPQARDLLDIILELESILVKPNINVAATIDSLILKIIPLLKIDKNEMSITILTFYKTIIFCVLINHLINVYGSAIDLSNHFKLNPSSMADQDLLSPLPYLDYDFNKDDMEQDIRDYEEEEDDYDEYLDNNKQDIRDYEEELKLQEIQEVHDQYDEELQKIQKLRGQEQYEQKLQKLRDQKLQKLQKLQDQKLQELQEQNDLANTRPDDDAFDLVYHPVYHPEEEW